jgi:glycosyltransferase involved in cell wall biosynthesis
MRIIHVLHSHGYGGAETHALMMMRGLLQAGHQVLFAGPQDSWLGQACKEHRIEAMHLRMSGLFDVFSHFKLRRMVKSWRPDIVHGHLVRGAHYAGFSLGSGDAGVPVCTAHATTAYKHMDRCRHIIAVSKAVRDNLVRHAHAAQKISVVYNGVADQRAPQSFADLRQELGIAAEVFAVVNAGRFIRDKGQDLLVQALAACDRQVHLYLMGDQSTEFGQRVQRLAANNARVHFLGYRNDVQRLLPAFDAYALPSRREALPLSLVEAFAARLPVLATAVGGVPELVRDKDTGLLVPSEQVSAIAQAVNALVRDTGLAQRLATNGRQLYLARLTAQQMVDQTLAVYRQCLKPVDADERAR